MANTVSILSYSNTFGDWVVITDVLANEVNNLGKGTYTKDTGSLILLGSSEALRANGPANFYSTLQVLGTGSSAFVQNNLTAGSIILNGNLSYYSNTFTVGAGQANTNYSYINVNRSPSSNASIRYNNALNYWDMLDVTNSTYYRILTTQLLTDSSSTSSSTLAASATNAFNISTYAQASFAKANSAATAAAAAVNSINGTTGSAAASAGAVSFAGSLGVTAVGSGSTITFSTPQDVRTTATPTFAGLTTNGLTTYGNLAANGYTISTNALVANTISSSGGSITASTIAATTSATAVSLGVNTAAGATGEIRATGQITAYYSDERLKVNLGNIPNALNKVNSLNGFYYEANDVAQALGYKAKREVGVSAQQIQNVLPEIVSPAPIDEQYLTVNYERIVPLLIEAIKELKQEIDLLKTKQ